MRLEARERARLVHLHQPAVTHHVSGENGCEPALDAQSFHCAIVLRRDARNCSRPPGPEQTAKGCCRQSDTATTSSVRLRKASAARRTWECSHRSRSSVQGAGPRLAPRFNGSVAKKRAPPREIATPSSQKLFTGCVTNQYAAWAAARAARLPILSQNDLVAHGVKTTSRTSAIKPPSSPTAPPIVKPG